MVNFCILNFLSVVGSFHPGYAVVFFSWDVVFEFLEVLFNVPLHADSDGVFCVIPFEVHTYVLFGFPINFVFDLVILIDGVKRDNLAFMEFSVGKRFACDCTIREHSSGLWTGGCALAGAVHSGCWCCDHPLNSGRGHPLSTLGVGTEYTWCGD